MAEQTQKSDNPDFKYIVRIANTDLDGNDQVEVALAAVKGIGLRLGSVIAEHAKVPRGMKIGDCTDAQVSQLAESADKVAEIVPGWMLNRQKDGETGEDLHHNGADLISKQRDDINRLKKIQTYRGIRHGDGQKVRGQRSRSNGRTGLTMGVIKKKEGQPSAATDKK